MAAKQWNSAFEADPAAGDQVSAGPQDFADTKIATRERLDVETDFTDGTVGNPTPGTETGRLREGAARAFHDTDANEPTSITVNDASGSNSLDDGRLFVVSDQENRIKVYDAGAVAWEECAANPYGPAFSGKVLEIVDEAISTSNVNMPNGSATELTGWSGGSGASNRAAVTVPADGVWYLEVSAEIQVQATGSTNEGKARVDIIMDTGGGFSPVRSMEMGGVFTTGDGWIFSLRYLVESPTASTTYTFGIQGEGEPTTDVSFNGSGFDLNTGSPVGPASHLRVKLVRRLATDLMA